MSHPPPSTISQASLLDLKAITAEHADTFAKEGRAPVKGASRRRNGQLKAEAKDPFLRPSPGLIKRMALEARNDAKRRHFQDEGGPSEEQRRDILAAKAVKYEAMRRGDYSASTERELAESSIDVRSQVSEGDSCSSPNQFERKWQEEAASDHSSDEAEASDRDGRFAKRDGDDFDDLAKVEYVDEMGRTRMGTQREAKEAERAKGVVEPEKKQERADTAYAEVLQSTVIHGDQSFFPVYEPDPEAIKAKYLAAEEEARPHHYDSTKEVRTRGAGQYQFSLDEEKRAEQMAALGAQRAETERARGAASNRGGQSVAQEAKKRKLDERRALIQAKRAKLLGGEEEIARLKQEKNAAAADSFLKDIEEEFSKEDSR
ncbi:hypothetical protein P7C73_g1430, partial [Tremellales sp. Uapishka_1]